jgi:hypothetical protein
MMMAGPGEDGHPKVSLMRRTIVVVGALLLVLTACDSTGGLPDGEPSFPPASTISVAPTTSTVAPSAPLAWQPCGEVECATLTVPRDYDDPGAGTFELAVARRRAERPDLRMGVLVFSPGGPGLPGTPGLIAGTARFGVDLQARFDVVSWDPRGVSEGAAIDCLDDPDYFRGLDPTPESPDEAARLARRAREFIAGCVERSGELLPYVSTVAAARDIDLLRGALGEQQIRGCLTGRRWVRCTRLCSRSGSGRWCSTGGTTRLPTRTC